MLIKRKPFYALVRARLFGGKLTEGQVDGLERILGFWEAYTAVRAIDFRFLAYMLATVYHETAKTMQPIQEYGGDTYLRGKKYWPWIGRGLVQLTWEENYRLMNGVLQRAGMQVDLLKRPEDAMKWEVALPVMFEGMMLGHTSRGDFTGKALEHYFNETTDDPVGARRIINGTDKQVQIAGYHYSFCSAILVGVSYGSGSID